MCSLSTLNLNYNLQNSLKERAVKHGYTSSTGCGKSCSGVESFLKITLKLTTIIRKTIIG